jgi:hypothetical protein
LTVQAVFDCQFVVIPGVQADEMARQLGVLSEPRSQGKRLPVKSPFTRRMPSISRIVPNDKHEVFKVKEVLRK